MKQILISLLSAACTFGTVCVQGNKRPAYGDSAYRAQQREAYLAKVGIASQICEKGTRGHPLTDAQRAADYISLQTLTVLSKIAP